MNTDVAYNMILKNICDMFSDYTPEVSGGFIKEDSMNYLMALEKALEDISDSYTWHDRLQNIFKKYQSMNNENFKNIARELSYHLRGHFSSRYVFFFEGFDMYKYIYGIITSLLVTPEDLKKDFIVVQENPNEEIYGEFLCNFMNRLYESTIDVLELLGAKYNIIDSREYLNVHSVTPSIVLLPYSIVMQDWTVGTSMIPFAVAKDKYEQVVYNLLLNVHTYSQDYNNTEEVPYIQFYIKLNASR